MKYLLIGLFAVGLSPAVVAAVNPAFEASGLGQGQKLEQPAEGDSVTLEELVAMNKKQFKGKTIAEFLASEEAKGFTDVAFRHTEEGLLQGVKIRYSDKLFLNVYVDEFKSLVPFNPDHSWSMDALKQEKIGEIRVVYVMHD